MERIKARLKSAFINGLLIILFVVFAVPVKAQLKYEREYPLKNTEVPLQILHFIDSVPCVKGIKYYKEESQDGESIEAKFTCKGEKYSVEFATDGVLQDIEVKLKKKDLEQEVLQQLEEALKEEFETFKFVKIQGQFKGDRAVMLQQLREGLRKGEREQRYEIIIKGKEIGSKDKSLFEYTFSEGMEPEKRLRIPLHATDNLEF